MENILLKDKIERVRNDLENRLGKTYFPPIYQDFVKLYKREPNSDELKEIKNNLWKIKKGTYKELSLFQSIRLRNGRRNRK